MKEETRHILLNGFGEERARTLVLCFDGTGKKFGKDRDSNLLRFFNTLEKNDGNEQLVYYRPGVGTSPKSQRWATPASRIFTKVEEAFATGLPDHVKSGYKFLMQNYRNGDKICLFGYSRGAYTARALAGMVYKVGLLAPDNAEQLDFAYSVYEETDKAASKLGSGFKRNFSRSVMIDFIGVWDTVSSAGIIPQSLPYSTFNDGVKVFRHALALDERRTKFRPSVWGEPDSVREELGAEPFVEGRGETARDDWVYRPPDPTHVNEVWFAGCHSDVGGSSPSSLSNISLRWMIKECFLVGTGILFDEEALRDIGLDPKKLNNEPGASKEEILNDGEDPPLLTLIGDGDDAIARVGDHAAPIGDRLRVLSYWWLLELIPTSITLQSDEGWTRLRQRNFGLGRYIPHADGNVLVHRSVRDRMDHYEEYKPIAYNWDDIINMNVVKWEE